MTIAQLLFGVLSIYLVILWGYELGLLHGKIKAYREIRENLNKP